LAAVLIAGDVVCIGVLLAWEGFVVGHKEDHGCCLVATDTPIQRNDRQHRQQEWAKKDKQEAR
jgi:hypothetical protein